MFWSSKIVHKNTTIGGITFKGNETDYWLPVSPRNSNVEAADEARYWTIVYSERKWLWMITDWHLWLLSFYANQAKYFIWILQDYSLCVREEMEDRLSELGRHETLSWWFTNGCFTRVVIIEPDLVCFHRSCNLVRSSVWTVWGGLIWSSQSWGRDTFTDFKLYSSIHQIKDLKNIHYVS